MADVPAPKAATVVELIWEHELVFSGRSGSTRMTLDSRSVEGPSPMQALAFGLAACMGMDVVHVIRKGLEVRRRLPALFHGARYTPLYADAGREENVVAFSLSEAGQRVVAVAPRLFSRLMDGDDAAPLGEKAWGEAKLVLEGGGELVNVLTGEAHRGGELRLAQVLRTFPVALLAPPP